MIFWSFLIGMLFCGLSLTLLHAEGARSGDKFGSAGTMFSAWCAFGMLLMAGTYGLGLVIPALVAAAVLVLRGSSLGTRIMPIAKYKFPLGVAALLSSVVAWLGVLNLMEEIPNV
ncbi:MAG: hypothetical protein AAGA12_02630 [Pseudomonadota bacterium]